MTENIEPLTPKSLSRLARQMYAGGPRVARTIQTLRPYICPFDRLLEFIPRGQSILDIGCGAGLLLALAARTREIGPSLGFDSNAKAIRLAECARAQLTSSGCEHPPEFRLLDVRAPWPEGTFPIVTMIDVLHHVPPVAHRSVIDQAAAKVAPGGKFIYKDIGRRPRWRAAMNRLHDLVMVREWIHYANLDTVVEWATHAGLAVSHRERINQLWYPHDLVVFEKKTA